MAGYELHAVYQHQSTTTRLRRVWPLLLPLPLPLLQTSTLLSRAASLLLRMCCSASDARPSH